MTQFGGTVADSPSGSRGSFEMAEENGPGTPPSHPLRWFPEFLEFGKARFRSQGRVLGACILVGIIAGLGGVAFSVAGQLVVGLGLEGLAGYHPHAPGGEPHFPWLPHF
jgi:hypothetical protein